MRGETTAEELIRWGRMGLRAAGAECGDLLLHAERILGEALGWTPSDLINRRFEKLSETEKKQVEMFFQQRFQGMPLQYLTGKETFWKSEFSVGPGVLIPRRETECLIEWLLSVDARENVRVAELGAGSGNIGVSVLQERPTWEWHAFETSGEGGRYAQENARLLAGSSLYHLHLKDFFAGASFLDPVDWCVANPPYVATGEIHGLSREVRFEPPSALDGGEDGLDVFRRLASWGAMHLAPEGRLICEIGERQGAAARGILEKEGYSEIEVRPDYAGLPRLILGKRAKGN